MEKVKEKGRKEIIRILDEDGRRREGWMKRLQERRERRGER